MLRSSSTTTSALLCLIVLLSLHPQSALGYTPEEYDAISACCTVDNCQEACDWITSNTPVRPENLVITSGGLTGDPIRLHQDAALAHRFLQDATSPLVQQQCCSKYPGSGGDPHFKTWTGQYFDYHGQCDLLLLDAPDFNKGMGLQIQVRTKLRYDYSFIEAAAVKIGDDTFEVGSFGTYSFNGIQHADLPQLLADAFTVEHVVATDKAHTFTLELGMTSTSLQQPQRLLLKTFKDWVSVSLEGAGAADFATSRGLMGQYYTGALVARDGTTSFLTTTDDINAFGQEWQIRPDEDTLFVNQHATPQSPELCLLPAPNAAGTNQQRGRARRLGEVSVTQEQAEQACAHITECPHQRNNCIRDVLASNDLEMAQAGVF